MITAAASSKLLSALSLSYFAAGVLRTRIRAGIDELSKTVFTANTIAAPPFRALTL